MEDSDPQVCEKRVVADGTDRRDPGAREFRNSEVILDDARPSTPALRIVMRQSLDQSSDHIGDSPVLPGEWLSASGSRKSSPKR